MTFIIKRCRGEKKKKGERKIDEFGKDLKIPESEISQCEEHIVKSKIGKCFQMKNYLKNNVLKFMKMIFIFMKSTKT